MTEKIIETIEVLDEEETIKTATIRGEGVRECPMGLPIIEACEHVGDAIDRMAPTEGNDKIKKANRLVYAYHKDCKNCKYAHDILKEQKKVDCNFGDTAAGKKTPSFTGSPLYPSTFSGIGLDGLYGYPLGFYADNNESRNLFFGLFSFLGSTTVEELIKLAEKYDECGDKEKSEILENMLKKLQSIKDEYKEEFEKIEKYLESCRSSAENKRKDTGILWDASQKWYGFRQCNR